MVSEESKASAAAWKDAAAALAPGIVFGGAVSMLLALAFTATNDGSGVQLHLRSLLPGAYTSILGALMLTVSRPRGQRYV